MPEFDEDLLEFFPEDVLMKANKPSKASERRSWKEQAKADLEELADLYPEYAGVLNEVQL
jgi:hypothetical protein